MGTHPLETAIAEYRHWMSQLATEGDAWQAETILATLHSRDRAQHLIDQLAEEPDGQPLPPQLWLDLANTDAELGRQTDRLRAQSDLPHWRKSVHPPEHHWWWSPPEPEPPMEALGWLWGGFTIALLTISLALAQDTASRFIANAPGVWSSLGAIVPVVLTLFAGGGALTQVGQQLLETILSSRGPNRRHWAKIKFALALALTVGLFTFHALGLPRIAQAYNQRGETNYESGDWASAQNNFRQATSLHPDYPQAQFNLGVMYEEYQRWDQAQTEYLKAVQGGYLPAYNNLARLYLREGDTEAAVTLLRTALSDPALQEKDPELRYVLNKNLGQARLDQGRLPEAETALLEAIAIGESLDPPRPDAYCLLAQVISQQESMPSPEAEDSPLPTVEEAWTRCLQLANRPEYDEWEGMARQALTQSENLEDTNAN
jgi:tetratricopeptide (TPR) repeat protein